MLALPGFTPHRLQAATGEMRILAQQSLIFLTQGVRIGVDSPSFPEPVTLAVRCLGASEACYSK